MTASVPPALVRTRDSAHPLRVRVARGFASRLRGLMFTRPLADDAGLLIINCASVHTCFMRYALDLVYLDAAGRVTQCVERLRPWRMSASLPHKSQGRTRHVLELPAGSIARLGIRPADRLEHPFLGGAAP